MKVYLGKYIHKHKGGTYYSRDTEIYRLIRTTIRMTASRVVIFL